MFFKNHKSSLATVNLMTPNMVPKKTFSSDEMSDPEAAGNLLGFQKRAWLITAPARMSAVTAESG